MHNFPLCHDSEAIASLGEDLHEIGPGQPGLYAGWHGEGHIPQRRAHCRWPCHWNPSQCQWYGQRLEGQHDPDGHVHSWDVEGLKHDLGHLLLVGLGVQGTLVNSIGAPWEPQFLVEGVVPDLLHVFPFGDDAVLSGVLPGQDASLALDLIPHIAALLPYAHHQTLVPWAPHYGREESPGGIFDQESGLAHTRAVVDNKCRGIIIHGELGAGVNQWQSSEGEGLGFLGG